MELRTPRDVGRQARACRRYYLLRQHEVAKAVGVSRQWIVDLEHGKPTLEIGLVLRAFETLGLDLDIRRNETPPPAIDLLTQRAEIREGVTLVARRRRHQNALRLARDIRLGNVAAPGTPPKTTPKKPKSRKKVRNPWD